MEGKERCWTRSDPTSFIYLSKTYHLPNTSLNDARMSGSARRTREARSWEPLGRGTEGRRGRCTKRPNLRLLARRRFRICHAVRPSLTSLQPGILFTNILNIAHPEVELGRGVYCLQRTTRAKRLQGVPEPRRALHAAEALRASLIDGVRRVPLSGETRCTSVGGKLRDLAPAIIELLRSHSLVQMG